VGNIIRFGRLYKVLQSGKSLVGSSKVFTRTLSVTSGATGAAEISAGSVNILLKLTGLEDTALGQEISKYLFYFEMATNLAQLPPELFAKMQKSAKKIVAKEGVIRKSAKNADEEEQINKTILELKRLSKEDISKGLSRLYRVQGGDVKPNISKFRFIFRNSKLEIIGKDRLHITFDHVERTIEFFVERGNKAEIFTTNIEKSFIDKIKSEAVLKEYAKAFPTKPQKIDISKTDNSFGLHESYFEELLKNISNPQIIKNQ
jgi:hypothetical protein